MKKIHAKSRTPKRRKPTKAFIKSLRLLEMNGQEPTRENLRRGYKVFGVDLASGPDRTGLLLPPEIDLTKSTGLAATAAALLGFKK